MIQLYFKHILVRPISIVWILITGIVSVVSYFGVGNTLSSLDRILIVVVFSILFLAIGLLFTGYSLFKNTLEPVLIRSVVRGTHYYQNKLIIILAKSPWIKQDQLLTLYSNTGDILTPFCILRVETFTSNTFPQCSVFKTLSGENMDEYLIDSSRWNCFQAYLEVRSEHLFRGE